MKRRLKKWIAMAMAFTVFASSGVFTIPNNVYAAEDTFVSAEVAALENQPEIQLSEEGNVDWLYFNNTDLANYEYKNLETSYLENVRAIDSTGGLTGDKFASFQYTDGSLNETNSASFKNEKRGIIFNHTGNGMTFDVKGSVNERILRIYTGTYQAKVGIEVSLNEEETPLETAEFTCEATQGKVTEIRFRTEKPEDILHIKIVVKDAMDPTWGSVSVHAVTLYDVNPPEIIRPDYGDEVLGDEEGTVQVSHAKGKISELSFKDTAKQWVKVPFQTAGAYVGPSWKVNGTVLKVNKDENNPHMYCVVQNGITYGLRYSISEEGILTIAASMKNDTDTAFTPDQASIVLGLDTYMEESYESYKDLFFPTLLRCEKTHLWGYMESPQKKVISLAVDSPVSSYHLEYESGQHRIYTPVLDMMQKDETLPERHPRGNSTLNPGESRSWNIKMKLSDSVESVKEDVEYMIQAPTIDIDRYTLGQGEKAEITVHSSQDLDKIAVTAPDGTAGELPLKKISDGIYHTTFAPAGGLGVYKLVAQTENYRSEAMISLRQSWSWYMRKAKEAALSHPAKGADCAESWYNLYSAYLGEKYFPDEVQKQQIDDKFEEIYSRVIKYGVDGVPTNNPNRIQNHSTTLGILVDKYEAEGDTRDLVKAARIADYLIGRQDAVTGAYKGPGGGDYTSVIYPAKSIMELMKQEKILIGNSDTSYAWRESYNKQYDSVKKAMENLIKLEGNLHTEGQVTYEDGAFSCSATQLSEFALMHEEGSKERQRYKEAALSYLNKHQALEQEIIPDSRINGGSLRFWEAQYDVLLKANPNNMMNSPHGWTAWNIYGLFNMYELTGDEYYLEKGMNAMGSCVQLMGFDGNLNWGFIADPYIRGSMFVQKENDTSEFGEGSRKDVTLGESYVDMISDWWRTPPDTNVGGYYGQGGACDNDVHEIFKAMEETVLTKAYVIEDENGNLESYNCSVSKDADGKLIVQMMESEITDEVSFNVKENREYEISFLNTGRKVSGVVSAGMSSVRDAESEQGSDLASEAAEAKEEAERAQAAADQAAEAAGDAKEAAEAAKAALDSAKTALEEAIAQNAEDIKDIEAKVKTAQDAADQASQDAADAATAAGSAQSKAEEAYQLAEEAKNGAEGSAEKAKEAAAEAQGYADAANGYRDAAQAQAELAEAAKTAAEAAAARAEAAAKKAEEAQKAIEEAEKKMTEAQKRVEELEKKIEILMAKENFKAITMNTPKVKSAKKKTAKVTWKAVEGAEGYEIQYALRANFKGAKIVAVKSGSIVSKTVKKLKSRKTYYVRARAYRMIDGQKIYTGMSARKKVRIK